MFDLPCCCCLEKLKIDVLRLSPNNVDKIDYFEYFLQSINFYIFENLFENRQKSVTPPPP